VGGLLGSADGDTEGVLDGSRLTDGALVGDDDGEDDKEGIALGSAVLGVGSDDIVGVDDGDDDGL
jgi:hypothetical protein